MNLGQRMSMPAPSPTDSGAPVDSGTSKLRRPQAPRRNESLRVISAGFATLILLGTFLFLLPVSHQEGAQIKPVDALFLATSAVCVTGLSTVDIAEVLSPFGEGVLLVLIQLGGLGIVTAGTIVALVRGAGLSLARERSIHATFGTLRNARPLDVFLYACAFVVIIELAGTLVLFDRLTALNSGDSPGQLLWTAVFHSVSAFCNAGMSTLPGGAIQWAAEPSLLLVLDLLVILGGIGLLTLVNLRYYAFWRRDPRRRGNLTLQTKVALVSTLLLLAAGAVATLLLEWNRTLEGIPWSQRLSWSLFHSVMTRTGGFNVVDLSEMHPATLLVTMVLMFIGGAPGSMAGGVKTVTFVLLVMAAWSALRRRDMVTLFHRRVPAGLVGSAVMLTLVAAATLLTGILLLMIVEDAQEVDAQHAGYWLALTFEAVSAFGTVGLSTGITPQLTGPGKGIIIALMFAGRVGPLLLALHLSRPAMAWRVRPPEENLAIG